MDPITPGIISGIATKAITGLIGQAKRLNKSRVDPKRESYVGTRVAVDLGTLIIGVIADLQTELNPAQMLALTKFLRAPEFANYLHGVAIAVVTKELGHSRDDLIDDLVALLVLKAGFEPSLAGRQSGALFRMFVAACERAIDQLRRQDDKGARALIGFAMMEKNAGYLRSLQARTKQLRQWSNEQLVDFYSFYQIYRQLIHEQTRELIPAYFEQQRRVALSAMYVNPLFRFDPIGSQYHITPGREDRIQTLEDVVDGCFRTVVLGDPGAGKSTLARKITHDLSGGMFGNHGCRLIPLLVSFRRYEEAKRERGRSLVEHIVDTIHEDFQVVPPAGAVEYLLLTGMAFVMLDGFDELLETHRRREIAQAVETFCALYTTSSVLITSRRVGYWEAPLSPGIFSAMSLMEFSEGDVREYSGNWFRLDDTLTASEQVELASAFMTESNSIHDIRSNALMLGLLCNVYRGVRSIPRNRAELYDQCARLLFERWDASRGIVVQGPLKADARSALQDVALWVFQSVELLARGIPEGKLRIRLMKFWQRTRYESEAHAEDASTELMALWRGRAWVLTDVGTAPSGERVYKFTHQTFLEYFASVELVRINPTPAKLWKVLLPHVARGEWDIVAQISVRILDQGHDDACNKIYKLAIASITSANDRARLNLVGFCARHLDVLLPSPATCRLVARAAFDLLLWSQPTYGQMPTYAEYYGALPPPTSIAGLGGRQQQSDELLTLVRRNGLSFDSQLDDDEQDSYEQGEVTPEEAMAPMLILLGSGRDAGRYVHDEYSAYCRVLLDDSSPELSAKAFVLGISYRSMARLSNELYGGQLDISQFDVMSQAFKDHVTNSAKTMARLSEWQSVNFWVRLVGARSGLLPPAEVVESVSLNTIFAVSEPVVHRYISPSEDFNAPKAFSEILLKSCVTPAQSIDNAPMQAAVENAFERVAETVRCQTPPFVDTDWMGPSGIREFTLRPFFRFQPDADLIQELESELHQDEPWMPWTRALEIATNAGHMSLSTDAIFGAAVILATVIEFENWHVIDESSDQIVLLHLGPLQPLEPLFVTRRMPMHAYDLGTALDGSPLNQQDMALLVAWASNQVDFVSRPMLQ